MVRPFLKDVKSHYVEYVILYFFLEIFGVTYSTFYHFLKQCRNVEYVEHVTLVHVSTKEAGKK